MTPPPKKKSSRPSTPPTRSPRSSANALWVHEQQKRIYLDHLLRWSLDHDTSLQYHGKISLSPEQSRRKEDLDLGKSVTCVLTDTSFSDARQTIIIRLFPPQRPTAKPDNGRAEDERRDSMDLLDSEMKQLVVQQDIESHSKQPQIIEGSKGHYKLVVRCGAGWMCAREYFSKVYFSHLEATSSKPNGRLILDESLAKRSRALGPPPSDTDSVTIRPLFHAFRKLPPELQEMILKTSASLSRTYNLCSDEYGTLKIKKDQIRPAIPLSTLFCVSKSLNATFRPYVLHSTDFQFGLTGFTNFLWRSGPCNRREIRRLSFHFGKLALLHCIRWLAPDRIFGLFEPPVATNPSALQYFWRCQIQDLVMELNLLSLTINVSQIPKEDLPMVVAILKNAFGSAERIHFVQTAADGSIERTDSNSEVLKGLGKECSWREMCMAYYQAHRRHSYFFRFELLKGESEKLLEDEMDGDKGFFDTVFKPFCGMEQQKMLC
ncbi:hypothetical protein EK21DRAFT_61458 [Setomelanomma holmii]|uniref:Uncharacterized protein n=1 Tax=Setomelanomma holmii TaxID=210430 RepID=A0A9P4HEN1_9PLEO|nr:hypothetical protein EK21DRAFT_61458 [Setomelanomma holmii]